MNIFLIFMIKLLVLSLFRIYKVYSKEITIEYQDSNWDILKSVINDNQNEEELIIKFSDDYYFFRLENDLNDFLEINVNSNIKFIGDDNGTVFDFNQESYSFHFSFNKKGYSVRFENIIFQNYKHPSLDSGLIIIQSKSDDFSLIIEKCTFKNNFNNVLY